MPSAGRRAVAPSVIRSYAGDVRYLGARDDVPALLALADLFVLPTYYREGVPRVLLEAAATGVPSIATDMPGCREVVAHGRTGLLVPPRDPARLAEAIADLFNSDKRRAEMGRAALEEVAASFDLSRIAGAYDSIYDRVLQMTA
jgi:glycosyltransferase involved in cell wall biosynthesis